MAGGERALTARFQALASHYLVEPCFCRPGEGHDNEGVEARQAQRRQALVAIPSAPTLEDLSSGGEAHPAEDKQELERRRLLAEASAPPEFPEDYDNGGSSSAAASAPPAGPSAPPGHDLQPSAPVLEDEDAYGPHYAYGTAGGNTLPIPAPRNIAEPEEPLPKYER